MTEAIDPTRFATFCLIWATAAAAPGGNMAFTISVSSRYGFRAGMLGAAGFVTANFGYMLLTAYGIGFAVNRHASVLSALRWLGVAYLVFLAWRLWTASGEARKFRAFDTAAPQKIWLQGALISLTNPKVILFIAVVMPQAISTDAPLVPQLLVLGLAATVISLLVHTVYSALGHFIGRSVPTPRARVVSNRIIAAVFVTAAFGLAFASIA